MTPITALDVYVNQATPIHQMLVLVSVLFYLTKFTELLDDVIYGLGRILRNIEILLLQHCPSFVLKLF